MENRFSHESGYPISILGKWQMPITGSSHMTEPSPRPIWIISADSSELTLPWPPALAPPGLFPSCCCLQGFVQGHHQGSEDPTLAQVFGLSLPLPQPCGPHIRPRPAVPGGAQAGSHQPSSPRPSLCFQLLLRLSITLPLGCY